MEYRIRPGVILTEVCGEHLLLATMEAAEHCPHVHQINETAAFFWRLLERQLPEEEMVSAVIAEYGAPEALIRKDVRNFLEQVKCKGYLLCGEDGQ